MEKDREKGMKSNTLLESLLSGSQTYRFLEVELVIKNRIGFECFHLGHFGVCWYEWSIQTGHCPMERRDTKTQTL